MAADGSRGDEVVRAIVARPRSAVLALDYDGTLAPIVGEPADAVPAPGAVDAIAALVALLGRVAVITGRPARQAVSLAGLAERNDLADLQVLGHYGLERWDATSGTLDSPGPAAGVATARQALPALIERLGVLADIEDKTSAVAVHTRRAPDPAAATAVLREPLEELARDCGLVVEPGRNVLELRPPGTDKGVALTALVHEVSDVCAVVMIGDDLGDLTAYAVVEQLRREGVPGLTICSGSDEATEVAARADLVVEGPDAVVDWLRELAGRLS